MRDCLSNHQPRGCLLNRLFKLRSKKTSKLRVTGLLCGEFTGIGEFPAQMASDAVDVSIWWRHLALSKYIPQKIKACTYLSIHVLISNKLYQLRRSVVFAWVLTSFYLWLFQRGDTQHVDLTHSVYNTGACSPSGHYWGFYPGALSLSHCNLSEDRSPVDFI